jgi:hypothetical protein
VAQVSSEKYRGLFLVGEFGELCTMCEAVVLCEPRKGTPRHSSIPEAGDFTLYHIQTRTFWSQITTIREWFIANFNAESLAQGHERPARIYQIKGDQWLPPKTINAHVALEPPFIKFAETRLDRTNKAWLSLDTGQTVGYCQRMPLWDALDVIEANAPGTEQ